jgi:polysaccharide export outer membrane protein
VTIAIEEYRNFYVNGMVEKPGGYPFAPGLTVRKAISIAGGFKERAHRATS